MGKSVSKQREMERKFTEERDKLFKEFSCAKSEIQRNFSKQRHELEIAFHDEIQKLYKIHQGQISTLKLQMRDSQLGEVHERLRGKLSRHLSWPIAESTPKQSNDFTLTDKSSQQDECNQNHNIWRRDESNSIDEWQSLIQHLKFALNNQKSLFESALLEEKRKMQNRLERERIEMEDKLFQRINSTLLESLKDRTKLLKEGDDYNRVSWNDKSDWVLLKEYSKQNTTRQGREIDSDSDEDNSGDSGVDERGRTKSKRGNYWRMKYIECQKRYAKKMSNLEDSVKRKEMIFNEEMEKMKVELKEKHLQEVNELQNIAAKELQKSLKEERKVCKNAIKEMSEKLVRLSHENDELKEKVNGVEILLCCDVSEAHQEIKKNLENLKDILNREN